MSTEPAKVAEGEAVADRLPTVDELLVAHSGDARAALTDALDDIAFLQRELSFASLAMSYGFARGWRPATSRRSNEA